MGGKIQYAYINLKKNRMILLISDKVDFETRSILSHKEVRYKIIKEWIHQKDKTIL